jgi:hypothetical protein
VRCLVGSLFFSLLRIGGEDASPFKCTFALSCVWVEVWPSIAVICLDRFAHFGDFGLDNKGSNHYWRYVRLRPDFCS